MNEEPIKLVYGTFKDNRITTVEGEVIECITYGRVRKEIDGLKGFYHLKQSGRITDWVIFEYVIITPEEEERIQLILNDLKKD